MNVEDKQKVAGQFRHVLTFFGGIAVGQGIIPQEALDIIFSNYDLIIGAFGAIVAAIGSIWSWKEKQKGNKNEVPTS